MTSLVLLAMATAVCACQPEGGAQGGNAGGALDGGDRNSAPYTCEPCESFCWSPGVCGVSTAVETSRDLEAELGGDRDYVMTEAALLEDDGLLVAGTAYSYDSEASVGILGRWDTDGELQQVHELGVQVVGIATAASDAGGDSVAAVAWTGEGYDLVVWSSSAALAEDDVSWQQRVIDKGWIEFVGFGGDHVVVGGCRLPTEAAPPSLRSDCVDNVLLAFDTQAGEPRWERIWGARAGGPLLSGGVSDEGIWTLEATSGGATLTYRDLRGVQDGSERVAAPVGSLAVNGAGQAALRTGNGVSLWDPGAVQIRSVDVGHVGLLGLAESGDLYLQSNGVRRLDADGRTLWSAEQGSLHNVESLVVQPASDDEAVILVGYQYEYESYDWRVLLLGRP